jgi:aryl-alcohol dehydrogenase-like predicted oxidoreductase
LNAVEELKKVKSRHMSMPQFALKWILMNSAITCTIPGARKVDQVEDNLKAGDLDDLSATVMEKVDALYDRLIKPEVHQRW